MGETGPPVEDDPAAEPGRLRGGGDGRGRRSAALRGVPPVSNTGLCENFDVVRVRRTIDSSNAT